MKTSFQALAFSLAIGAAGGALAQSAAPTTSPAALEYARQGWTDDDRQTFYTTSQGSHMIPYSWFKALRRLDVDEPFGGDQLQRYGYLPNDKSKDGLPVGLQVMAPVLADDRMYRVAAAVEAALDARRGHPLLNEAKGLA